MSKLEPMFGLMKGAPRLQYCGTCKTLGTRYGQKSRLLLNNDAVFLAELLEWLRPGPAWSAAYRSFNCLAMPEGSEVPETLDFAAAAAVVLAHFRIADQVEDTGRIHWRAVRRLISPAYRAAERRLRGWDFPMDRLVRVLKSQGERESKAESLAEVAEPTARATALFFEYGARLVGRSDAADSLGRAGYCFGSLIYTLDAHEDRVKDARSDNFNPLKRFGVLDGRAEVLRQLRAVEAELPAEFAVRARIRVEERLGLRPRVLQGRCRAGVRERFEAAVRFGRTMRERECSGAVRGAFVLATAAAVAFLMPHHVRGADNWRHAMGLGMNLMALGAVFASAPGATPPAKGHGKSSSGACAWCDGDSWDFDCCDCGCCGCDSCDCG